MKLSIVIPVFNNFNFTKACLNDLKKLPEDHEVIIVDNGSTDGTTTVKELFPNVVYLRFEENKGFAHACNHGYAHSNGKYVMFLNNDIRVRNSYDTWTQPILEKADTHLVGPTGGLLDSNLSFIKETMEYVDSPYFYMSGWNLTSSKEIWEKLRLSDYKGPFSEEFGIAFFEDTDLGFRARDMKIPCAVVPVPVTHFGHMTAKKINLNQLYRSARELFVKKWNGGR